MTIYLLKKAYLKHKDIEYLKVKHWKYSHNANINTFSYTNIWQLFKERNISTDSKVWDFFLLQKDQPM